ncbi:DUF2868 domain-containing protein [Psychromonas ossibalaenae]|uniref:DUF2868 domain-containing protein n=1 Tax=Psychromonas ossibalaenae TaxID=444922 RepID=UPI0003A103B9|nr:DUF2868 domain-containing protein [Psychromonas ossibalaenae]
MNRFQQILLAEGVRAVEGDSPSLAEHAEDKSALSFEQLVLYRAGQLDLRLQISPLFVHFKRLFVNLSFFLFFVLFILGAGSVQKLFFSAQGTEVNFFWAFALFFIPNLLTLLLWGLFYFQGTALNTGWLQRFSLFSLKSFEKRFNQQSSQNPHYWSLFRCYFQVTFSRSLGRYQLSALTHLLWFSYFCGATLMLVVMLATHQVDFVWQTSILSVQSFQWLTESLAYLPNLLGFPVPTIEQIQQSHLGAVNLLGDAENTRFVWSSLLISSLVLYGLLPRLLLMLLMRFLLTAGQNKFSLPLTNPYYVQLRQLLKPNVTSLGISDPDVCVTQPAYQGSMEKHTHGLPEQFYPVAVELSEKQLIQVKEHIKDYAPDYCDSFRHISDYPSQQKLLADIVNINSDSVLLYLSLQRAPDRGLLGFIKALTARNNKPCYLLLINDGLLSAEKLNKRRSDWYGLAQQADVSLDNVIQLDCSKSNGEAYE